MQHLSQIGGFAQMVAISWLLLNPGTLGVARAEVPTAPPTFSDPLDFDNTYFPFEPGALKVFRGKDGSSRTVAVDIYLTETRSFEVSGAAVACRILEESNFENGDVVERTLNYFAEADDGTVYYFGEVVDNFENGEITGHGGSWLVGGPTLPTDPTETATATTPAVFMPANPEVGDIFKPEDLFPFVDETDEILDVRNRMQVAGTTYEDVLQVLETTQLDSSSELKWYAPEVGVIQARTRGEILRLVASTLHDR